MNSLQILENIQSLIFEVSEYIPNDKYISLMNEGLKLYKLLNQNVENQNQQDEHLRFTFEGFCPQGNNIINEYFNYRTQCWEITQYMIQRLIILSYTPRYIAEKLNEFFMDNDYFYCPVYNKLLCFDDYGYDDQFIDVDYDNFHGRNSVFCKLHYEETVQRWVKNRFANALENI